MLWAALFLSYIGTMHTDCYLMSSHFFVAVMKRIFFPLYFCNNCSFNKDTNFYVLLLHLANCQFLSFNSFPIAFFFFLSQVEIKIPE